MGDWLKKKDRNQRRPGSRRSQEDGGGACELPLRAGPAALHISAAQLQQPCKAAERRQQHLWVGTPVKRQPPEGELLQWAPHTKIHPNHLDHHLSHTFPGRTRPKKEDWLKKKDRKQRRPGCRRKKRKRKRG